MITECERELRLAALTLRRLRPAGHSLPGVPGTFSGCVLQISAERGYSQEIQSCVGRNPLLIPVTADFLSFRGSARSPLFSRSGGGGEPRGTWSMV
ncbi:hypothetical protein FKM82_016330 [Ascaphus truei]